MFQISEKILLTIWVGGMWAIGYVVAPVLFQMLDKPVAGNVAGQLFTIMSYIGLFSAVALIINILVPQGFNARHWQLWTLVIMLVIIVIGQFVLQPMMAELKAPGLSEENRSQFGRLHGIASVLFLMNSLAGLALVVSGLERKM
ncbi:MAG: hypothetical protein BMS9Abin31_0397 [Gammaproteobacteria bacterium]|nr:MAG: hypothetical protein BMS9Abin31_0397 [Gammaproteobacteria bacterium]